MAYSIAEIAELTGLEAEGDGAVRVTGAAEPASAGPDDLALAMSPKHAGALAAGRARAAVLWPGADWRALGLEAALFAPRARLALAGVTRVFAPQPAIAPGIDPAAAVHPEAVLGADVGVGPFSSIGADARIGAGSRIASHVSIGAGAVLGDGALVHPGARIAGCVRIGARAIIHENAVIGSDGFSFVTPERGAVESAKATGTVEEDARNTGLLRIASLGGVEIGDDVEIGAGTCIDAGTIAPTRIGDGTKIDNLVQIGHNCRIGSTCMICGHVGLSGSVTVGDRAVLGGKTGVADHLTIGADAVIAGGSLVGTDIPPATVALGAPAIERREAQRLLLALRRLPRLVDQVRELRQRLGLSHRGASDIEGEGADRRSR